MFSQDKISELVLKKIYANFIIPILTKNRPKKSLSNLLKLQYFKKDNAKNIYLGQVKLYTHLFVYHNFFFFSNLILNWFNKIKKNLINKKLNSLRIQTVQVFQHLKKTKLNSIFIQNIEREIIQKIVYDNLMLIFKKLNISRLAHNKFKVYNLHYNFYHTPLFHKTLTVIKNWKKNTTWVLTANLSKILNSINYNRLKNIFLIYIKEIFFWEHLKKLLNIGILLKKKNIAYKKLTQLLFNIYLTELDWFIHKLFKVKWEHTNNFYSNLNQFKNGYIKKLTRSRVVFKRNFLNKMESYIKHDKSIYFSNIKSNFFLNNTHFLHYLRYDNFFLITIQKFQILAFNLQKKINSFLKSNLHINIKYNKILNWNQKHLWFLNFKLILKKQTRTKLNFLKFRPKLVKIIFFRLKKTLIKLFYLQILQKFKSLKKLNFITTLNNLISKKDAILVKWKQYFNITLNKNAITTLSFYYKILAKRNIPYWVLFKIKYKLILNLKKQANFQLKTPYTQLRYFSNNMYSSVMHLKTLLKNSWITNLSDKKIVNYYLNLVCNLLNYYRITDNWITIKLFSISLKWNCYSILSKKHKESINWIGKLYQKTDKWHNMSQILLAFPTLNFILSLKSKLTIIKNGNFFTNLTKKNLKQNIKF